jgi:hypothetical protein
VVFSAVVRDQFLELLAKATRQGRRAEVLAAGQALHGALTWVPEEVGEPVCDLPTLGRVQVGSFGPIQLRIAVNDEHRLVFVSWFRLRPAETG